jgi:hypothetical protein
MGKKIIKIVSLFLISFGSSLFVVLYSYIENTNARCLGAALPCATTIYAKYSLFSFLVPIVLLSLSLVSLRRKKDDEIILSAIYEIAIIFSVFLVLGCLLSWKHPYMLIAG